MHSQNCNTMKMPGLYCAIFMLQHSPKEASGRIEKLLKSAIANWESKQPAPVAWLAPTLCFLFLAVIAFNSSNEDTFRRIARGAQGARADYGEWKTGRRTTALIFSTVQFSHKFGLAVGAGLAGIMLSWFGFVANEVQTEGALFGIRFMFSIVPAAFALMGVVAIYFYRIDSELEAKVERELLERRAAAAEAG